MYILNTTRIMSMSIMRPQNFLKLELKEDDCESHYQIFMQLISLHINRSCLSWPSPCQASKKPGWKWPGLDAASLSEHKVQRRASSCRIKLKLHRARTNHLQSETLFMYLTQIHLKGIALWTLVDDSIYFVEIWIFCMYLQYYCLHGHILLISHKFQSRQPGMGLPCEGAAKARE